MAEGEAKHSTSSNNNNNINKPDIATYTHSSIFNVVQPDKNLVVKRRNFKDFTTIEHDISSKLLIPPNRFAPNAGGSSLNIRSDLSTGASPSLSHKRMSSYIAHSSTMLSVQKIPERFTDSFQNYMNTNPTANTASAAATKLRQSIKEGDISPSTGSRSKRTSFDKMLPVARKKQRAATTIQQRINHPTNENDSGEVFVQLNQFTKKSAPQPSGSPSTTNQRNAQFIQISKDHLKETLNYLEDVGKKVQFQVNDRLELYNPRSQIHREPASADATTETATKDVAEQSKKSPTKSGPLLKRSTTTMMFFPVKENNHTQLSTTQESQPHSIILDQRGQQHAQKKYLRQSMQFLGQSQSNISLKKNGSSALLLPLPSSMIRMNTEQARSNTLLAQQEDDSVMGVACKTQPDMHVHQKQATQSLASIPFAQTSLIHIEDYHVKVKSGKGDSDRDRTTGSNQITSTPVKQLNKQVSDSKSILNSLRSPEIFSTPIDVKSKGMLRSAIASKQQFYASPASTNAHSFANVGSNDVSDVKKSYLENFFSEQTVKSQGNNNNTQNEIKRYAMSPKKARFAKGQGEVDLGNSTAVADSLLQLDSNRSTSKSIGGGGNISSGRGNGITSVISGMNKHGYKLKLNLKNNHRVSKSEIKFPTAALTSQSQSYSQENIVSAFDDQYSPIRVIERGKHQQQQLRALTIPQQSYTPSRSPSLTNQSSDDSSLEEGGDRGDGTEVRRIFTEPRENLNIPETISHIVNFDDEVHVHRFEKISELQNDGVHRFIERPAFRKVVIKNGIKDFIKQTKDYDQNRLKTFYRFGFTAMSSDANSEKLQTIVKEVIPSNEKGSQMCNEFWSERHVKTICERTNFAKEKELVRRYLSYKASHPVKSSVILSKRKPEKDMNVADALYHSMQKMKQNNINQSPSRNSPMKNILEGNARRVNNDKKEEGEKPNEKRELNRLWMQKKEIDFNKEKNLFKEFLSFTERVQRNNVEDIKSIQVKIKEKEEEDLEAAAKNNKK